MDEVKTIKKTTTTTTTDLESKVILFNDEIHSIEEVVMQIIKAIKCTLEIAKAKTMEVHEKGKAVIYSGDLGDCLMVSSILEEIGLHTQVET